MLEYGSSARWRSPSDGDMVDLPAGKAGLLLAAFVMHANQVVSTDRLFEFRWRGRPPGTAASTLLTGLYQVIGCGVPAVWAHGGDPLVGGSPQIVGGSAVRAGKCPHRLASELLGEVPAVAGVTVMGGRGVGAPGLAAVGALAGWRLSLLSQVRNSMGPLNQWPDGHLIMALSRGPPVERMVNRRLTSAGRSHRTVCSSSR